MTLRLSSPHVTRNNSTAGVMQKVLLALLPGITALTYLFGWGSLIQVLICLISGLVFEALAIWLRRQSISFFLSDYSAAVTAVLLGVSLPPTAPYWVAVVGMLVAIIFGKQVYGGLGNNPFNPAMVAYALLLVSFPVQMTAWIIPGETLLSLADTTSAIFAAGTIDGYSGATPLDLIRNRAGLTTSELWSPGSNLSAIAQAYQWVALAWAAGGVALLYLKVFTWHTPISMLASLFVISAMFYGYDPDTYLDPVSQLTLGATMLGAFFIATDPVSSATSTKGKLVFGAGIGLLVFVIRTWGNYPDAVAFAVLVLNLAAPMIDQYTQPRAFGHKGVRMGPQGKE
ncbi:MAG TPA: RnfABCDGE type electron transport complex subunit D [Marinobacterium sp.]|nr:RnfABCDGE type electron transport complex subunit D [Marinobacterium sp.]